MHPHPRLGVDELAACRPRIFEGLCDIGDAVRHVVQAGPALGQELSDRRILSRRAHELDLAFAGAKECSLQPFFLIDLTVNQHGAEGADIQSDGGIEVGHRDPDVVDLGQHVTYSRLGYWTEKSRVTAFRVRMLGNRPSILSLPRSSFVATPRPTSS